MKMLLVIVFSLLAFPHDTEELYGSYWCGSKSMMLNLDAPDRYNLFIMERDKGGMVTSKEFSRGTYATSEDTVILAEALSNNKMTLRVTPEDKLETLKVKGLKAGDTFLCQVAYYENGNPRFEGSWKKERKHGTWVYYDPEGNIEKKVEYRRGKIKD